MPRTCGGQDAPGGEWGAALGVWGILLLPPFCALIFAPLGTGHTDLAPAQRRGRSRTNPPSSWGKRAARASASGCEARVAAVGLLGWCARSGTCMLAVASPTHRHVTGVHQQRCADAPRTPRRLTAHILTIWGESDASWALPGDSGRDLLLGVARLVGRPVGGVAARELSGRAVRDGRLGLVGTHHNRHTDGRATQDERDALHFDTRTLLLARTTGNRLHGPPPPRARETRHTGRAQP